MPAERRAARPVIDWFAALWAAPGLLWQGCFFLAPLGLLVWLSFWTLRNFRLIPDFVTDNWVRILTRDFFWPAVGYSFSVSAVTAALASAIAFPVAYFLAFRAGESTRRLAIFLLITPFFTSYLVRVYAWTIVLAREGVINTLSSALGFGPLVLLSTPAGAVVGYLTLCLPLVILIQLFTLSNIDRSLVGAAHNLGCGPLRTVVTVILPLARTGLIVAAAFAFILAFGDYVSPALLGGSKPPTLSILIVDQAKSGNHWPRAAVIAVVMILILVAVLFAALAAAYGRRRTA